MWKLAAEEGDWELVAKIQAAPVQYQSKAKPRWEAVTHGDMKDLCKAAKDHGRGSSYFDNLLNAIFTAHVMVPHDLCHFMHILLSPLKLFCGKEWGKN